MIITGLLMPVISKINYKLGAVISAFYLFSHTALTPAQCFSHSLNYLPPGINMIFSTAWCILQNFKSADYFSIIPGYFYSFSVHLSANLQ